MATLFNLTANSPTSPSFKLHLSPPTSKFLKRPKLPQFSLSSESVCPKTTLLNLISDQERGLKSQKNSKIRSQIIEVIEALAVIGRDSVTTDSSSLSGTWRMLWTTEKEQLFIIQNARWFGTKVGDALQVIDVDNLALNNVITFPPDGVFFVRSNIAIASNQRVNFRFESVYLDDNIRVAKDIRGDYLVVDRAPYEWKE
ncbi:Probable plastid-lipid-associated protein 11, chloroplastic, variant 2 [Ancistrocladus abbreviatus]